MTRRQRRAIHRVRKTMADFGYPLDDLTDEEVVQKVAELGKILAVTGITAQEAVTRFRAAAREALGTDARHRR